MNGVIFAWHNGMWKRVIEKRELSNRVELKLACCQYWLPDVWVFETEIDQFTDEPIW